MATTILDNAVLLDCTGADPQPGMAVVVEGQRIRDIVRAGTARASDATVLDLRGHTLMPGLIDAHVHLCAVEANPAEQHRQVPPSMVAVKAVRRIEQTLMQGFTTVRDAGGADFGFREAVANGIISGPRIKVSGNHIYQTGGHGDKRRPAEICCPVCTTDVGLVGVLADGPDEMRKAVREELRRHADQIKLMCSGGAMSPGDELDIAQFSIAEISTAVEEARAAHRYVMAHAYSGAAIKNAVAAGVRSIEHGNLMDEEAADAMKAAGTYLVPTMITYESIWRHGKEFGIPPFQLEKIAAARETAVASLELAKRKGLKIGLGSDLLGAMFKYQPHELELQGQVQTPMEVLLSATRINAEILRMDKQIGTVEPGKLADLLVVRGDPLKSLAVFQDADKVALIMKDGKIYKNIL